MASSRQKRARPTIEPIKTNTLSLQGLPRRASTPSVCSLCAASPSSSRLLPDIGSPLGSGRLSSTTEPRSSHPHPAAPDQCITPLNLDSGKSGLLSGLDKTDAPERPAIGSPTSKTDKPCCARCGTVSGRRQHVPVRAASTRNVAEFQRFREILWRRGHQQFGNAGKDTFFVVPEEIRNSRVGGSGNSQDGARSPVADESRLPVRAVIRSKNGIPIGLRREFDLRELRATIPEPIPSPRSPNFDRSTLLAPFSPDGALLSPAAAAATYTGPVTRRAAAKRRSLESLSAERRRSAGSRHIPIHLHYARAQLPMLAAFMLSPRVRSGDTIQLSMPHPKAWAETAAFVYTGELDLLSDQVRDNILYLGGKV